MDDAYVRPFVNDVSSSCRVEVVVVVVVIVVQYTDESKSRTQ